MTKADVFCCYWRFKGLVIGASEEDLEEFLPNIEIAASIVILRLSPVKPSVENMFAIQYELAWLISQP